MENFKFEILEEDNGKRIDKYLSSLLDGKSRSYIQRVIDDGKVNVNGKIVKSNYKLKIKDIINLEIPEPTELEIIPENIPLDILYEDKDVIVVNKSQGMVVHPAPGSYNGTMVNALLYHCKDLSGINGVIRPGIVHRIDKDTSGILVVAKNDNSHNILAEQLKDHSMTREYYALVEGIIKEDEGTINEPLARHPKERIKISVVKGGREAITHFKVIERFKEYTLVKCILETGRTHQIRVHMAYIGHPLVGDPVYGYKKQKFKLQGQMLHAKVLGFIHPSTKEYMQFESPLPDYFTEIINKLKSSSL
ncbi:RluA family pseudouridine synthase [Clostridium cadaveris]|uniref:RluA family pseudouridine synthase n=1 Tax=Clostridium cadaveris TaxID=1529 RepID=UPI0025A34017|nr:RluA family pseudouridine synthase [Clostridium cadaveris]MDM8313512.1 RluA family pseudouridine synthase [Clostridium cadaveris]